MTRRDALRILPASALATSTMAKDAKPPLYVRVFFKGSAYIFVYVKNPAGDKYYIHGIVAPDKHIYQPNDPRVPFKIAQPVDATSEPQQLVGPIASPPGGGGGGPASPPRKADAKHYFYILDIASQDRVIVHEQETAAYVAHFTVPPLPQGMTLNADNSRLYITHLEIGPNSPLPPAPPRVTVWDKSTRTLVTTIDLPAGRVPRKPVLSPDGNRIYIANNAAASSVLVVDPKTNTYTGEIPLGATGSIGKLAVTLDGAMIYAANIQTFPARIFAIDVASASLAATLTAPSSIKDILLNATGSRLYTCSESRIVVYDTATFTEAARIDFNPNPRLNMLALSIDGGVLFAKHEFNSAISAIGTTDNLFIETLGSTSEPNDGSFMIVTPFGPTGTI